MAHELTPCIACHRHVRAGDAACPFCGAAPADAVEPRAPRAVAFACAALAGLMAPAGDTNAHPHVPRDGIEHGPAPAYGGPPERPGYRPEVVVEASVRGAPALATRVRDALHRERSSFAQCMVWEPRRAGRDPSVSISFDLSPTGEVSNAHAPGDRLGGVATCVVRVLERIEIPRTDSHPRPAHVQGRITARHR